MSFKRAQLALIATATLLACKPRVDSSAVKAEPLGANAPGRSALLVIDVQNCFLPAGGKHKETGSLAVKGGLEIIPRINQLMASGRFDLLVATQDWHPRGHVSFASTHAMAPFTETKLASGSMQMLWPDHCIQESYDAELAADLEGRFDYVQTKGVNRAIDSYSGFFDNQRQSKTELDAYLKAQGVTDLYVVGIALDYCVAFSALDARDLGYATTVIRDATAGVDQPPGNVARQLKELQARGVKVVESRDLGPE